MSTRKTKNHRISFGAFDAAHLYSLAMENFYVSKKEGVCFACVHIKRRLENMIGKKEVRRLLRLQIKKHPD